MTRPQQLAYAIAIARAERLAQLAAQARACGDLVAADRLEWLTESQARIAQQRSMLS